MVARNTGPRGSRPCPEDLGKLAEEMGTQGWKLVTLGESAILAKPSFDPVVVEGGGQDDGGLSDPPSADYCDSREEFYRTNDPVDQLVPSAEGFRRRWRKRPRYARCNRQAWDLLSIEIACLFRVWAAVGMS